VAVERTLLPRLAGAHKDLAAEVPTAQLPLEPRSASASPPASSLSPSVLRRARPRRAAASLAAAESSRHTPVPLLDASGDLLSVPRAAVQSPRSLPSEESGRGAASARRQLDEQDPYK
jgi:hypothetical protein